MGPYDRAGDPTLRTRMETGDAQRRAVLVWLVEGARRWYAADKVMPEPPAQVRADTHAWRADTDLIRAYIEDRLVFDGNAHIMTKELLTDVNEWGVERGHRLWSDKTLAARFGDHELVSAARVEKATIRACDGLSRRLAWEANLTHRSGITHGLGCASVPPRTTKP